MVSKIRAAALLAAAAVLLAVPEARAHSSLLVPPSRNAVDRSLAPWKGGSHGDGKFGPDDWGCNCVNGTSSGPTACDVGQSCFCEPLPPLVPPRVRLVSGAAAECARMRT